MNSVNVSRPGAQLSFSEAHGEVINVGIHFPVSPFFRSVMGSNKEPDLVHLEARTVDGRK